MIKITLPCFSAVNDCDAEKRFGSKEKNQRGYMYIIGKTNTGESTLIKNLVILDMKIQMLYLNRLL
jgi:ribosome biogenesis GTPase A